MVKKIWGVRKIFLYNKFSDFLETKYGTKVYKLPINIPSTCPNRDGTIGSKGCIFCGEEGAGFETLSNAICVKEQLAANMNYISKKYKAEKFIAYFQNYSNTYLPFEQFKNYISESVLDKISAIYVSTRPDCISEEQLDFLRELKESKDIDIVLEIGLQTANENTLKILNRGHSVQDFKQAVRRIISANLGVCAHYIADLPWDNIDDSILGAKLLSSLNVDQVKIHSLYVLENTVLGDMYKNNQFEPVSLEEYINRIICFLEYLSPQIVVQRLIGRAPKERTLFCNWGMSWWKIRDMLEEEMCKRKTFQGKTLE